MGAASPAGRPQFSAGRKGQDKYPVLFYIPGRLRFIAGFGEQRGQIPEKDSGGDSCRTCGDAA